MSIINLNPHDPADIVGKWEAIDPKGVDAAVQRAPRAEDAWRFTLAAARGVERSRRSPRICTRTPRNWLASSFAKWASR